MYLLALLRAHKKALFGSVCVCVCAREPTARTSVTRSGRVDVLDGSNTSLSHCFLRASNPNAYT